MNHVLLALLLGGLSAGQQPAAPSLQQLFDQASKAAESNKCADAIPIFEQLESDAKAMRNSVVRAAIEVRKGGCLIVTGQAEQGEASIRRGLPVLAAQGAGFAEEVRVAHRTLGELSTRRFDYTTAAAEYKKALEGATGTARLQPLLELSQVLAFDRDGEALVYATEARQLALDAPGMSKHDIATVQTQYARVLMNQGKVHEAYAELKDSLRKQGGLDLKVDIFDLITRSDLAIAAALDNDKEAARKYLAYTGAGRFRDSPFARASSMQPPLCGGVEGLKPEDFAIVEFSLAEDGHVSNVTPIYSTGGRSAAIAFARSVADWSWKPEYAKAIPPLFRYMTRVEIRCSMAGERPSPTMPLADAYAEWMESKGHAEPGWKGQPDARAAPLERAALAEARRTGDRLGQVAALTALGTNAVIGDAESTVLFDEALTLVDTLGAPTAVRTYIAINHAWTKSHGSRDARQRLRELLARPELADDPLSAATLRLLIAAPRYQLTAPDDAAALLDAVIDAPGLAEGHPLKVAALLQQANRLAATGDIEAARRTFDRTGLTTRQCAFIGLQPALRHNNVDSDDYPRSAVEMGFEGWVRSEFDVAKNGTTVEPRVVTAYPPFVFDEAGEQISNGLRYTASYRPEDGVACTAQQESLRFELPR